MNGEGGDGVIDEDNLSVSNQDNDTGVKSAGSSDEIDHVDSQVDAPSHLELAPTPTIEGKMSSPALLDIQLLETTNGYYIKELAYKMLPIYGNIQDNDMHYICFRHDATSVPLHRTFHLNGAIHDRFTGLDIECGEDDYSDLRVIYELQDFDVIFLKGHNKKRVLRELFARSAHAVPQIINVDAATVDDEDVEFLRKHDMTAARFSFKHVYRRFSAYLQLLFENHWNVPSDHPIYLSNAITNDRRFDVFAHGRSLWICPFDHRCVQRMFTFQRCAALNLGLLETLWYTMHEKEYYDLLKRNTNEFGTGNMQSARWYYSKDKGEDQQRHIYRRRNGRHAPCNRGHGGIVQPPQDLRKNTSHFN